MHARDYGFMAANPFGRKAMHKGEESKIIVKPGESLHLRFGVWIYETEPDAEIDIEAAYRKYIELCDCASLELMEYAVPWAKSKVLRI